MCGIAGFFTRNTMFSRSDLENMTNALAHRGPDASGFYYKEKVGLGHRRLSIIDLSSSADQPMKSQCGRYVIVFNGEIYNYKEIAEDLNISLRTSSDTEVLIEAFAQWGSDFVHRLNGMFAFVIYDIQKETSYVFRDRMGIKPLYYYYDENNFVFASELKAFKKLNSLNVGELDATALNNFLYLGYIPTPYSIFQNIKKFPSASYAIVGKNQFEINSYWKLEEQILEEGRVISDIPTAKAELEKLLISSVKYRMISDVPFGTFLSGGVDSSLVTAIAQSISPVPIKTFSIGFNESKFNEANYAKSVAKHLKTEHNEKILNYQDALDLLENVFEMYDEPFADNSAFPTLLVSQFAKEKVSVILSGDGGDESYLGYGFYEWGNRMHLPLIQKLRHPIAKVLEMGTSKYKRAAQLFKYKSNERLKSHIFSQEQYCFSENELSPLLLSKHRAVIDIDESIYSKNRKLSFNEEQALFDLKYYLQDDLFVKVDRSSMFHALEVRVPLMDHRLAKFAMNLSEDLRKKDGISKYLLKQVLYDYVPKELFNRPKWGFGIPLIEWLKNEWNFLIHDYLSEKSVKEAGLFNYSVVNQYVKRFSKGEDFLYNRIWLMILAQKFVLGKNS